VLIYTWQGGNNYIMDKKQSVDQKLERGNLALERSMHYEVEIRVICGIKDSRSPSGEIYIDDGLYTIEHFWLEKGLFPIGLCSADGTRDVGIRITSVLEKGNEATSASSGGMYTACEMAVIWAKNQLARNASKDQIMTYLDQLCDRLPSPNGQAAVDCNNLSSMSTVPFTIGDRSFDLTPEQYILK